MARTKQTARCIAQRVPRRAPIIGAPSKRARKGKGRGRSASNSSVSSSESSQVDVTKQQFSLKFDNQPQCEKKAIKGDRFECKNCKAILSHQSELQKMGPQPVRGRSAKRQVSVSDAKKQEIKAKGSSLWVCEFCDSKNEVPAYIEIPKDENPCYYLGGDKLVERRGRQKKDKMILYCIDISGSMDTYFQGKTRLEAVKQAIRDQIKRMKFQGENIRVGLVTFGSEVNVKKVKGKDIQIPSALYYNFEEIAKSASKVEGFDVPVQTHHQDLEKMIKNITTYGCTALGPGLVTSIQLAGKVRGSKIVLCTDGMANQGLIGPQFYTKAAKYAQDKGVLINILSIKGDSCNLKELGKLSLQTGGSVMKIDPSLLGSQFNKISKENVFGTDSKMRIVVNHFFQIQNSNPNQISKDKTVLTQDFGNFTADTQLTFNFRILSNDEAVKKGVSLEIIKRKRLPMQIQLTYTNPEGQRYLQVVNDHRDLTLDQAAVFSDTNFNLFSASMLQKISKLIKDENFGQAEAEIKRYRSLIDQIFSKKESKKDLDRFIARIDNLERVLNSKLNKKGIKSVKSKKLSSKKKSVQIKKAEVASKSRGGGRGRGRGARGMAQSDDEESESEVERMASDSEEQVLYRELRARS